MNLSFRKLEIRRTEAGKPIWVAAVAETCEFYGWTEAFSDYSPPKAEIAPGRYAALQMRPGQMDGRSGGRSYRIVRSPKVGSYAAGQCNRFRMSSNGGITDLRKLAEATQVDWYWIVTPSGKHWSREQLLS